jgi:hypothetical protein
LNLGHFNSFTFILVLCGESCLLVSLCVGDRCDMADSDEDLGRIKRSGVEDRRWSSIRRVLGDRTIERSGDAVCGCTMHKEMRSVDFLVWPQNQGRWFLGLDLKIGSSSLVMWVSKSPRRYLSFSLKTKRVLSYRLHHKINEGRSTRDTRRNLTACFT